MSIYDVQQRKVELEQELRKVIGRALDEFEEDVGCTIQGLDVQMIECTELSGKIPSYRLSAVKAKLELP